MDKTKYLSQKELERVNEMINYIGLRTIEVVDNSEDFTRCQICGLKASTVEVNIYEN